jgi:tetratricopeptide (TPR) repeat protein
MADELFEKLIVYDERGGILLERYQQGGRMEDLNESIQLAEKIVYMMPESHPERCKMLSNLGARLGERATATCSPEELNLSITISERARDAASLVPDLIVCSNNLAANLSKRFNLLGNMADLNAAITISQWVVNAMPEAVEILSASEVTVSRGKYSEGVKRLNNLANRLSDRFDHTGSLNDLNLSIEIYEKVIAALPDHPSQPGWLSNLSSALCTRYERTLQVKDLTRGLELAEIALYTLGEGHVHRASALRMLGVQLAKKSKEFGDPKDLDRAIECFEQAMEITAHPDEQILTGTNLAMYVFIRAMETRSIEDLNRAILIVHNLASHGTVRHAHTSNFLGAFLFQRYLVNGSVPDADAALTHFYTALNDPNYTPVSRRVQAGRFLLQLCAQKADWSQAYEAACTAIQLFPKLTIHSLENADKQVHLSNWGIVGFGSDAAAAALFAGKGAYAALDLLECGRGVLASSIKELRADVNAIRREHPGLANTFDSLRNELLARDERRHYQAMKELDSLLERIRQQPSHQDFLRTPRSEVLLAAAQPGPIIIVNASEYRCDAILVEKDRIWSVNLPSLNKNDIKKRIQDDSKGSPSTLAWLWDAVACPVLDALGFTGPSSDADAWPRVWWIPTGILSGFPLHAAGRHGQGAESVLDRVMSSYSSSIKAIIDGRRSGALGVQAAVPVRALLVSMPTTPRYAPLCFVAHETQTVRTLWKSMCWETVEYHEPCKQDVLRDLPASKIFHFAGHGQTDPSDPSQSQLLLRDWETDCLNVESLLDLNLRQSSPFLAYLSACGTGRIKGAKYLDESIHLVGAYQLAGFRHVIGTLWSVEDSQCVEMARITYEEMNRRGMTDEAVCQGLHLATRKLREDWMEMAGIRGNNMHSGRRARDVELDYAEEGVRKEESLFWVPYVHFGV